MKATNPSNEERSVKRRLYEPGQSSRGETVAFGTLGLLALATICIALVSASVPAPPGEDQFVKYFRSGQMAADMRTASALMHYFFESEPAVATNEPTAQKQVAMPTTNVAVEPKA